MSRANSARGLSWSCSAAPLAISELCDFRWLCSHHDPLREKNSIEGIACAETAHPAEDRLQQFYRGIASSDILATTIRTLLGQRGSELADKWNICLSRGGRHFSC
jgi:hypothetical protein